MLYTVDEALSMVRDEEPLTVDAMFAWFVEEFDEIADELYDFLDRSYLDDADDVESAVEELFAVGLDYLTELRDARTAEPGDEGRLWFSDIRVDVTVSPLSWSGVVSVTATVTRDSDATSEELTSGVMFYANPDTLERNADRSIDVIRNAVDAVQLGWSCNACDPTEHFRLMLADEEQHAEATATWTFHLRDAVKHLEPVLPDGWTYTVGPCRPVLDAATGTPRLWTLVSVGLVLDEHPYRMIGFHVPLHTVPCDADEVMPTDA